MRLSSPVLAAPWLFLAVPVSAFYPYIPPYWKGDTVLPASVDNSQSAGVTLPLHRTPVRRENRYAIASAQTPSAPDSVAVDQDGMDYTYFSTLYFGSSDRPYHMLMDTAASNTWVMSSECTTDVCNAHNTLGKDQSSTLTVGSQPFSITYGTGSVNGTSATDIAHFTGKSVNLTFGLATGVSSEFANYALDGILGFGRGTSDSSGVNAPSIIDVLASQSLIKAKLIGIHLSRASSKLNDGQMNLGAPNPDLYDGDLAYVSIQDNARGFWEIALDDAAFAGKQAGLGGQTAIIDTGTSFMLIPPASAKALHGLIPGSVQSGESYTVPCSSTEPFQLVFGGKAYNVSAADYVGASAGNGACHSNVIGRQAFEENQWLVGDVFLKNVYAVFDFDQKRIGFGVKSGSSSSQTTASSVAAASSSPSSPSSPAGSSASGPVPLTPAATTLASSAPDNSPVTGSAAQTKSASPSKSLSTRSYSVPALSFAFGLAMAMTMSL